MFFTLRYFQVITTHKIGPRRPPSGSLVEELGIGGSSSVHTPRDVELCFFYVCMSYVKISCNDMKNILL